MRISDNLFWRRLHSFTGFAPLGAFLVFHLYTNSYALGGPAVYDMHIRPLRQIPYLLEVEVVAIYLPLLYHSLYGLYIWYTGKANVSRYGYARNWLYTLQRVTGLIAVIFIGYHVYDQRFRPEPSFESVAGSLHDPLVLGLYVIGVASVAWHFTNGAWNFFVKWGVTIGKRAQAVSLAAFALAGIGLVLMGLRALAGFAR